MNKTNKILLSFFLILISGMGYSQSVPSYVPTNGLVGWWGFNGNAQDGSGNGNHGTVNGATLTTDRFGNQNGAYSFDGISNFIESVTSGPGGTGITLSLWYKTNRYIATGNYVSDIFSYGSTSWGSLFEANFNHWSAQTLGPCFGPSFTAQGTLISRGGPVIPDTTIWHHVVIVLPIGASSLYDVLFFLNGLEQQGVCSFANYGAPPINIGTALPIRIGKGHINNGVPFYGQLDDIGIWNRALTQQEITNLYNAQSGITIPTLTSCLGDTSSVTISHPTLTGVANASLRMTYNPDSLTYVGFNSLNPAFSGMTISGGNGSVLLDWNSSSNQTIAAGNMVNLRFRVNGNSNLNWDTTTIPCEFSDVNFNVIPQTYVSGSISQNTQRLTWNRDICQGQSFTLGNQSYTSSGTYQGRRFGTGGACDTLITLNLNVIPTQTILPAVTTCSNLPYSFNGLLLTSSGTYLDTLTNSLGCDSILQLNLTVNPAYNQNQSVVICTGTTYSFGGQNLTASGTYSHTYATANGCDSLVQLNLSVADSVSIQSTNGSNGFCPGGSLRIGLVNPIPNVSYQWTKDGSILTSANSDSLVVSQSGVYQLTVQVSPTCSVTSNTLTISVLNCNQITGDLKYDNNNQTPLAGVPVHLKTLLGNIVASDTTDATGGYEMSGYNNGNYVLDANVNYSWGGVNSTDALQVTRFFTSLITLSPLRIRVGDVNGSGITNSGDALLINRRITGLIPSFSVGNFVNNLPSVSASGNPIAANLRVLSTGDVNGTYNPLPLAPALVLDTVYGNGNVGTAVVRFTTAGSGVFERGIVWSSSPNPTLTSNKSIAGTGGFGFTHSFSSIDPNNIQYARAYARTSAGVYYSNERSFTSVPWNRCPETPSVTDIDGNVYNTVQIGTQCWTQSNLKVSKYRNGDTIPTGLNNNDWHYTTSGAYAIYNNDPVNDGLYGKLYNYYSSIDIRGLCPTGWHVPTETDWNILAISLDSNADTTCYWWCMQRFQSSLVANELKEISNLWYNQMPNVTNSTGFSGLPGGLRVRSGDFLNLSMYGWWGAIGLNHQGYRGARYLSSGWNGWDRIFLSPGDGVSIRCLKNTLPQVNTTSVTNVTQSTALVTGEVKLEGEQNTTRGFCYSTIPNPTISNDTTINGTGAGVYSGTLQNLSPATTYYVRAYATNSVGTSYASVISFISDSIPGLRCPGTPTVSDIDGNFYYTVQIGNQCWTQSNHKSSRYSNGDSIPTGLNNNDWRNTTFGAYAIYNNDPVNDGLYGKLYNYHAVMDSRGLCPSGWRVPSDDEWMTLFNHLGGQGIAGGAMKSTTTQPLPGGWISPNTGATNSSGFTALPGGGRTNDGNYFTSLTDRGNWWSTTGLSMYRTFWHTFLDVNFNVALRSHDLPTAGFSVRCLKNTLPQVNTTSVNNLTASSAIVAGEVISEGGYQNTTRGFCYSTISNPTLSNDTTMNGTGLGVYSGTLMNLTPSTTYYVRSYATNSLGTSYGNELNFTTDSLPGLRCLGTPTVIDIDGNLYYTVQIGTQCWTQSNLKVSKYRNGDNIPTGLSNSVWENTTSGAYAIYNNDPVNDGLYGKLYNHYAVTDSRGLCPTGWHVPSDGEWNTLVKYLDPNADTVCVNCWQSSTAGGALKSTAMQPTPGGWNSPNSGATNSSGFTAPPGGQRDYDGVFFGNMTYYGFWWSSSVSSASNAWNRYLNYDVSNFIRHFNFRTYGFSVRCLKD